MAIRDILRIRVLEESAECGVFLVKVQCNEPQLTQFWCSKPPFCNGQVEQADVNLESMTDIQFVLRATNRGPNLPNSHYWGPFILALCLDALQFRFQLPSGGIPIQDILEEHGELILMR